IFGAVAATFAQTTPTASATTTLNVNLNPLQTILVGQPIVNLNYKTTTDYADGVTSKQDDHLTIYSTGAFAVNVKSDKDIMKNGVKEMATSQITVQASDGTKILEGSTYTAPVPLKMAGAKLLSNSIGGVNKTFAVTYKGAGSDDFVNNYIKGTGATVYTTVVTYSIEAQ